MSSGKLCVARSCANPLEAELVRALLTSAGIDAVISRDDMNGVGPDGWISEGISVLIRESDRANAAEVLRAVDKGQEP